MTSVVVFASSLGQIFKPLYEALAWIIAFFYAVIPNYAIAIGLLTVAVMIITAPLTVKSTRSTIAMQRLAPELKKLQQKYKGDRATLNEEMMKLYKEHNINPAGGCLPLLIQLPVFIVLYGVIRGLTNTGKDKLGHIVGQPNYIGHHTRLYHDLALSGGHMKAFGLDLAANLFSHHHAWTGAIPYAAIVVVAIALQYLQMRQLNSRNPAAAQANPQMQMMQRYMPLIFAVIYLRISAGVNIYFVVSSLCRIAIQEAIFRSGVLNQAPRGGEEVLPGRDGGRAPRRRTLMERLAEAQQRAMEQQRARQAEAGLAPGTSRPRPATRPRPEDKTRPEEKATRPDGEPSPNPPSPADRNGSAGGPKRPAPRPPAGKRRPSGGAGASGNGAPARKAQPQGQSRSAKKRPRKAR